MKILYDHQIFTLHKFGGISRYFAQIISHFPENTQTDIAIKYSNNEYINNLQLIPEIEKLVYPFEKFLPNFNFRGKHRLFNLLNRINPHKSIDPYIFNKNLSIELLKKQDFDIFHPTYYDDYFLEYIGNKPFVLTIHDMIHEIYPEMLKDAETSKRKAILAKKASHIIAVSDQTKKDIIEILDIPENKISVIYHANSLQENHIELKLPENYLLFVGARSNYKNFLFFASCVAPLLKKYSTLMIICTGHDFDQLEFNYLNNQNLEKRFLCKSIKEDELFQLYKNAKALIFPSYYEGFGIPILEAFQAGCPVVLSNTSCFPEIARDAAIYFSPKSLSELRLAIERIIDNEFLRNELINKGYNRLKDFSWLEASKQTLNVYSKLI